VTWQTVLDVIDAVESWIAGQSYWVQVVVLLAVLGPLCYLLAGLIDRVVEAVLAWHSRRDLEAAAAGAAPVEGLGSTPNSVADAPAAVAAHPRSTAGQASRVKSSGVKSSGATAPGVRADQ
jgi:hypothetical protein